MTDMPHDLYLSMFGILSIFAKNPTCTFQHMIFALHVKISKSLG